MPSNLDRYRTDLDRLVKQAGSMQGDLTLRHKVEEGEELTEAKEKLRKELLGSFEREYQSWYTESAAVIRQLIPHRIAEFDQLYRGDGKRKNMALTNYNIQDWLTGVRAGTSILTNERSFNDLAVVSMRFHTQLAILEAVRTRFESSLFDIRQLVQADLFDSEIASAEELLRCGFGRAGGALAGVVLEKHLAQVALNHSVVIRKKEPTISDLNDALKSAITYDIPVWRGVQRLGDIRNLCDHHKDREPTAEEIQELISGVAKLTKTVF